MVEGWRPSITLKAIVVGAMVKLCAFRNRNCPADPGTGKELRQEHMAHTPPGPNVPRSAELASCMSGS